jgi:hypothetical protein
MHQDNVGMFKVQHFQFFADLDRTFDVHSFERDSTWDEVVFPRKQCGLFIGR